MSDLLEARSRPLARLLVAAALLVALGGCSGLRQGYPTSAASSLPPPAPSSAAVPSPAAPSPGARSASSRSASPGASSPSGSPAVSAPAPAPVPAVQAAPAERKAMAGGMDGAMQAEATVPAAVPEPPAVVAEDDRPYEDLEPVRLKVGLASDLARLTLPCCDGEAVLEVPEGAAGSGAEERYLVSPMVVEPAPGAVREAAYRLQLAALKDEDQARGLAERLGRETGQPGDAHFDASVDLYRVRVGRWASREQAESARRRLPAAFRQAWVVTEGGEITDPALRVSQGGRTWTVPGRWLAVRAEPGGLLAWEGKRYRDRLLVFLNDRGSLNLINELTLEDYLRGVVPREMGPAQFPEIEALKAQAVAARTYTLRNLGEFRAEGYDICATPRCQVYGGAGSEHPLSDRAVAETAHQILLWDGSPADALYTSTCGGHTENVVTVFPLKNYPYLKGVPCIEAGVTRVDGGLPEGSPFPHGMTRALLPVGSASASAAASDPAGRLAARLERLALLAGIPVPADRLASLDRREVQRFLLSFFDLALDMRLFTADPDLRYLVGEAPAGWDEEDLRRAAFLLREGLLPGPAGRPLDEAEIEGLLLALAERLQVVTRDEGRFVSLDGGTLTYANRDGEHKVTLPASPATFRDTAFHETGSPPTAGDLALVAGDRMEIFTRGEHLLGLLQQVDPQGVAHDRESRFASWRRFKSDGELTTRVEEFYPGLGFTGFDVLDRGVSGRVGRIRLRGTGGKTEVVEGLAIRWLFDVPETLFTAQHLAPAGGRSGWLFNGKGWGHGVGMCQNGAFGMARRGASYRDILDHYYTGTRLVRVRAR